MRWNYENEHRKEYNALREKFDQDRQKDMLMGGERMFFNSSNIVELKKPETKSFIGKIRKKLVNLYYV